MPARIIRCPECKSRFELDPHDARLGHAQCPECRAMIPVRGGALRSHAGGSGVKWIVIILVLVGLLCVGCCGGVIWLFWSQIKPTDFPEQTQDYADARKT